MVKGISRQVILVQSPDPKLFEQAIFILKDEAVKEGITDEALMKEAKLAIRSGEGEKRNRFSLYSAAWAGGGAMVIGLIWLLTVLF